jgi:DNA repair protein RadC
LARLSQARHEVLVLTLHDQRGRFRSAFEFSGGGARVVLPFRSIVQCALANHASGLVLLHNHPTGDPTPSRADIAATRGLAALCVPLELHVHDHLVVGRERVVSMQRAGILTNAAAGASAREGRA